MWQNMFLIKTEIFYEFSKWRKIEIQKPFIEPQNLPKGNGSWECNSSRKTWIVGFADVTSIRAETMPGRKRTGYSVIQKQKRRMTSHSYNSSHSSSASGSSAYASCGPSSSLAVELEFGEPSTSKSFLRLQNLN